MKNQAIEDRIKSNAFLIIIYYSSFISLSYFSFVLIFLVFFFFHETVQRNNIFEGYNKYIMSENLSFQ